MSIEKEFFSIATDNENGAFHITKNTAVLCKKALSENYPYNKMEKNLLFIKEKQNMMAPVINLIKGILSFLKKKESPEKIVSFLDNFLISFESSSKKAAENAADFIPENSVLLTHSFSSLVCESILKAQRKGKNLKVFCTESRPNLEGVKLAEILSKEGIKTTIITDAEGGFLMKEADIFLIGADAINKNFLVHKIGTLPITLSAKFFDKQVVSVASSQKFLEEEIQNQLPQDKKEIIKKESLNALNFYFDFTPLTLIDKIITERK
jgi:translation initiation factor 2B subunit (eIF-2B alpha/beta/delta family)